ncbi:MAG: hypothetical protein IJQ62_09885 [Clostridia bacterium]|nr:hypothetical protein [Clostridia bacterium]
MKTAKQMLKAKQAVKDEMDRRFPQSLSDDLWNKAETRLEAILRKYDSLSGGVRTHTDHYIFPSAAIYLTRRTGTSWAKRKPHGWAWADRRCWWGGNEHVTAR